MPLILGLETSCDETAAAVVEDGVAVRSNVVWSQHDLHEQYAGVVPEIASRAHVERLWPVVRQACEQAGTELPGVDAIAVGNRPGLVGSLIVGVAAAKALAWSLGKPLIGVDHVRAHLYAASLRVMESGAWSAEGRETDRNRSSHNRSTLHAPPSATAASSALGLVISGGHTTTYRVASPLDATPLGRTIDDAAGEAFDKAAVILDAGYPGGPAIQRLAERGDPTAEDFPRSLLEPDSLDFSFSGLKTALLYRVRGQPVGRGKAATFERDAGDLGDRERADIAASFQQAIIDVVVTKLTRALGRMAADAGPARSLIVGGGVSANAPLRAALARLAADRGLELHIPPMAFCVDNAAMIAGLAHHHLRAGDTATLDLPAVATTAM